MSSERHERHSPIDETGVSATVDKKGELTSRGQDVARRYAMHWLETQQRESSIESEFREMRQVFTAIRLDEDMALRFAGG